MVAKKNALFWSKVKFTCMIVLFYMIGRCVPLVGVDTSKIQFVGEFNAQSVLTQTISGDLNQCSILALGIAPYMMASIPIQIILACRSADAKAHTSPFTVNRVTTLLMMVLATMQAVTRLDDLVFTGTGTELFLTKCLAVVQMVTGAVLILWLSERNKRFGIGGQTMLIYINIIDGMRTNLLNHSWSDLKMPLFFSLIFVFIVVCFENTEKRIPMQRIAVYNIYGDKNYQAIKLNPIGIMPIMFASAFSMLPRFVVSLLLMIWPSDRNLLWFEENAVLTKPLGIGIYIASLFLLTIIFSIIFINPSEISEQLLKSGDSIVNIHTGRDSRRYLWRNVILTSMFSATVMSICMGIPMCLQLIGKYNNSLIMIPASAMMMTGMWCTLFQEIKGIKSLDAYEPFL